jgi:3-methylcrotonyl-CoA carboxylase alpha subunit
LHKTIKKLAIANRGEVAVRIITAAQELGIKTVLLHSDVDRNSRAFRLADQAICIGGSTTQESYLNIEANISGALAAAACAIHPGFGFLSENSAFVESCEKAGLIFVGPPASAMKLLGDKMACKTLAQTLGLPLVPGYQGEDQSVAKLTVEAQRIGYPVLVKAAAGGGGRGMKVIRTDAEAKEQIESATREALSSFGSAKVFLEKYLERAKHIEFQVFCDSSGRAVHYFDRECSVQRRHQKIIEEAVSPSLSQELRRKMGEAACLIAEKAGYRGAGTVEFLLQDEKFYLLEVNTRLQVEHPVTELVCGVDLVKKQIATAQGSFLHPHQDFSSYRGHAIECRVYAEDPFNNGMPSTGKISYQFFPSGPGRRFDYGFEVGDEITAFYDPMISKVIVWDENRPRAIQKMIETLRKTVIHGVHTNIPYLIEILSHVEFIEGRMTTKFIETYFPNSLESKIKSPLELAAEKMALSVLENSKFNVHTTGGQSSSPFLGHWRS